MTKDELSMVGFEIVAYSGDARSTLLSLLKEMRAGNFEHVEEKLKDGDSNIVNFEEQKLRFVIADENFRQIYVSANGKGKGAVIDGRSAKAKIKGEIIDKVNRFDEDEFKTVNNKRRIKGRGIIKQGNHKYYVYIYEIKTTKNILFSYYAIFFSIVVLIAAAIGMIVSMIIANRISKPIKQIELNTRLAVKNG